MRNVKGTDRTDVWNYIICLMPRVLNREITENRWRKCVHNNSSWSAKSSATLIVSLMFLRTFLSKVYVNVLC